MSICQNKDFLMVRTTLCYLNLKGRPVQANFHDQQISKRQETQLLCNECPKIELKSRINLLISYALQASLAPRQPPSFPCHPWKGET